jgi:zinc transport system ATP-binding protein
VRAGRPPGAAGTSVFRMQSGTVAFDGVPVFEQVDLAIERGSFVVLLGPNGSGKTTLVRALLGLQPLTSGTVQIEGVPLARYRDWQHITFVPQRIPAATGVPVSALEMVRSARISPQSRLRPAHRADNRIALDALAAVGLAERRHARMDTLSGGQQRRVMIARSLAEESDILVLDEPFAGVDLASQQSLARLLGTLHGRTIIMVSHGLGAIADLVTRAIVLDHGRIVHDGATAPEHWSDVSHHSSDERTPPSLLEG